MIYDYNSSKDHKKLVQLSEKVLFSVDYIDYIRKVLLSKERRAKYYIKDENEPKAAMYESARYAWRAFKVTVKGKSVVKFFLYDQALRERVIANSRVAGKPRYKVINGQELYNGKLAEHTRNKIMKAIKDSFKKELVKISPINPVSLPIRLHCIVFDHFSDSISKNMDWDLFNRFLLYGKAFEDCLVDLKIIPDDNRRYVTQSCSPLYHPIAEDDTRMLRFIVTEDSRYCIKRSKFYKTLKND